MKSRFTILSRLLLAFVAAFFPLVATAQLVPTVASPHAQRNALGMLRTKINIFQNATRTAPNFGQNAEGNVMGQFQELRSAFEALKQTLDARQWGRGADSLAELDAGLDILSEAFNYYQNDLALGRPAGPAIRDMCQILREGVQIWSQQLNKTATALRIGVG